MPEPLKEPLALSVQEHIKVTQEFLDEQDARITSAVSRADRAIQDIRNISPETRYVQDIFIGGSANILYPVWWLWGYDTLGTTAKLSVMREYHWNGGTSERPLDPNRPHQAALHLQMEGNDHPWGGGGWHGQEIKRFGHRYNPTVSHVSYNMYCKARKIDTTRALSASARTQFSAQSKLNSGLYLRGGGLRYRIVKNWTGDVNFHDGSDSLERTLGSHISQNVEWYAEPISMDDILLPEVKLNAFA